MFDCDEVTAVVEGNHTDPRLNPEILRCLPGAGGQGSVLLVGVVHDHPASLYRVAAILTAFEPDILALELPPLALPLFEFYAEDVYLPPRLGGEMSLALQTVDEIRTVGIDAPDLSYLRQLTRAVVGGRLPTELVSKVLRDLARHTAHAVACWLGAIIGRVFRLRLRLYDHTEYEATLLDSPSIQARHETDHLRQQQTFLTAIEIPRWRQFVDQRRDDSMADRIRSLRSHGDVIAIVGVEHLDPLVERLE